MIFTEPLSEDHLPAIERFRCTRYAFTEELTEFLQHHALEEQYARLSSTTLFFVDGSDDIDAYVTLSASAIKTPPQFREAHPDRVYLPVVYLDYLAVADHRLEAERGFGQRIFGWVLNKVVREAAPIGIRLIVLDVRVGNWHAYRAYSRRWGFVAAPLRPYRGQPAVEPPDPDLEEPPGELDGSRLIPMYYDLARLFGAPTLQE